MAFALTGLTVGLQAEPRLPALLLEAPGLAARGGLAGGPSLLLPFALGSRHQHVSGGRPDSCMRRHPVRADIVVGPASLSAAREAGISHLTVGQAELNSRMEGFERRLDRIKHRLELIETPS